MMLDKEELLSLRDRYLISKGDVRFLHQAIISILHKFENNYQQAETKWLYEAMESEFKSKSATNEKRERIAALVAHIVSNGADVATTLEAVAEWLGLSKTTVRDAYYKLVKVYGFDPKIDNPMDDWGFRVFYGHIPHQYARELEEANRSFPDNPDYERVYKATVKAIESSIKFENAGFENEIAMYRLMFGDQWLEENTQKKSA